MIYFLKLYLLIGMAMLALVLAERKTFADGLAKARMKNKLTPFSEVVCILFVWLILWPSLIPSFVEGAITGLRKRRGQ